MVKSVNANAFTADSDIYLGQDQSVTDTRLIGHELTHVVQQDSMSSMIQRQEYTSQENFSTNLFPDFPKSKIRIDYSNGFVEIDLVMPPYGPPYTQPLMSDSNPSVNSNGVPSPDRHYNQWLEHSNTWDTGDKIDVIKIPPAPNPLDAFDGVLSALDENMFGRNLKSIIADNIGQLLTLPSMNNDSETDTNVNTETTLDVYGAPLHDPNAPRDSTPVRPTKWILKVPILNFRF